MQQEAQRAAESKAHQAEMEKLAKQRIQDIRRRLSRSRVYCNCGRIVPPAEHKENCQVRCAYTGKPLWPGHDMDVKVTDLQWFEGRGGIWAKTFPKRADRKSPHSRMGCASALGPLDPICARWPKSGVLARPLPVHARSFFLFLRFSRFFIYFWFYY